MTLLTVRSRVDHNGVLTLDLPSTFAGTSVEVVVQSLDTVARASASPEALGWPPGFFEATFGSFRDQPLVREPEGQYEVRESVR